MAIGPIPPVVAAPTGAGAAGGAPAPGFADAVKNGLESVSNAERAADAAAVDVAAGTGEVHQLMAATAKASLSMDLLVQTRNKAVEAYQEIMRIQV